MRKMIKLKIETKKVAFAILSYFVALLVQAQPPGNFGSIKGLVTDQVTLQPVPFCNIYISELGLGTTSDANGEFHLERIPEGRYNLKISFVGYNEKILTEIQVVRGKTAYHEVQLTENALALSEVEVTVHQYENIASMPSSTFSLSREEIFRSPASNGNIFRAISVVPGVQSGGGSFAALAVRGQGAEENAMFVDGFPVFELSHLSSSRGGFDEPNGGRFSIFGPRVVDGLVIQTGGFSSLYGRKSSSYLELSIKEGNPENADIDVMASLTGASINYSGPTYFAGNTTVFASYRYQNFEPVLNLTDQADLGFPSFSDLTVKTITRLNRRNKLTLLALYNPETFKRTTENVAEDEGFESDFLTDIDIDKALFGAKLERLLSDKSNWINWVYYRSKSSDITFGEAYPELRSDGSQPGPDEIPFNADKGKFDSKEDEVGIRSVYTLFVNEGMTLKAGIDLARVNIDHVRLLNEADTIYAFYRDELPADQRNQNYFLRQPQFFNSAFADNTYNASGYADFQFTPVAKLTLNAGVRYDYTGFSGQARVSPRLSGSYLFNEKSSINFSTGIFYQDPLFVNIADNSGVKLEPERAIHYIAGFKHYFTTDLKFTGEIYYKDFQDLIVRPNSAVNSLRNQGVGYAYGIDLSIVKRLSNNYNGQISYSYSQSKRDNKDGIGEYDHLYSQPHLFNFLLTYQSGASWILSGKLRYSTGQPAHSSIVFEDVHEASATLRFGQELTGRNDIRNDDFIGVDVRVDRRFQFPRSALTAFIDIQNLLNRDNASSRRFVERTGEYKPISLGILPTLGVRFEF